MKTKEKSKSLEELSAKELKERVGKILEDMNHAVCKQRLDEVCYIAYKDLLQEKDVWDKEYDRLYEKAQNGMLNR